MFRVRFHHGGIRSRFSFLLIPSYELILPISSCYLIMMAYEDFLLIFGGCVSSRIRFLFLEFDAYDVGVLCRFLIRIGG